MDGAGAYGGYQGGSSGAYVYDFNYFQWILYSGGYYPDNYPTNVGTPGSNGGTASTTGNGGNGTANTGGGGGAGLDAGGSGGSGIVVIRYLKTAVGG